MNIAIIPARGGSKRIPKKNIRNFYGKPMISYAINAALEANIFQKVIVSTDSEEVRDIAIKFGAEAPFIRPAELADDFTPTAPVVAHAINQCEGLKYDFEYVCCIYPSVPLLRPIDIIESQKLLIQSLTYDFCYPIVEYPNVIQRALRKSDDGSMSLIYPEFELTRTQDFDKSYYDPGQFYWGKRQAWISNKNILRNGLGYEVPQSIAIDIDTNEDWRRAELFYKVALINKENYSNS